MLDMIDMHRLHACFPHLTHTIPALCLFAFDSECDSCIPKDLELCLYTDEEDLRFTTSHSLTLNTNCFYLDPESENLFADYTKLVDLGFKPFIPHTDPYELLLMFCNRAALLCALTPNLENQTKPSLTSTILPNCILTLNRFNHQSEPFKVNQNQREYQLKVTHYGQKSYIQPCSSINTYYLNAITRAHNKGQIMSQPVICHQGELYKKCHAIDANHYHILNSNMTRMNRVSQIYAPIVPEHSFNLLETVTTTDFNFLYNTNPTEQLKALLDIHTFKQNRVIEQLHESIVHIHLIPTDPTIIKYMIIFNRTLGIHSLFIAVLRRFFQLLHPINLEVIVDYAVQPL